MKKVSIVVVIIIIIIIIICLITCYGCSKKKEEILLTCKTTLDSEVENVSKEKITITFTSENKTQRTILAELKETELNSEKIDAIIDALKQNYCNSEIKSEYSCDIVNMEQITIEEQGNSKDVMGIEKETSIEEYQKMLEKKGFKCSKKK